MIGRVGKAVAGPRNAHDIGDEGRRPGIALVIPRRKDPAVLVMLAGPARLATGAVETQPPIFADALPESRRALGFLRGLALIARQRAEGPPFAQRDRHRVLAIEWDIGLSREVRLDIGSGARAERQDEYGRCETVRFSLRLHLISIGPRVVVAMMRL